MDLDALLRQTETRQCQYQQHSSQRGAAHPSALDGSNSAQALLALTSPAVDSCFEQLRSVMEEHAQDSAKWDVWADEEDGPVVDDAHAVQVCQYLAECNCKQIQLSCMCVCM